MATRTLVRPKVCVVIPAYRVSAQILPLLKSFDKSISKIIVVDDLCPEGSGYIAKTLKDRRVEVIFHEENQGVGGALKSGYRRALELNAEIIVKVDGDGQMNPANIPALIAPIIEGKAGYTKGNRFFEIEAVKKMPRARIFGNLGLSFLSKLSTGYWQIFDPNNGFTAISRDALSKIPLDKVDSRYFFESDMLFRLYLARIITSDVSIPAIYADEKSSLKIRRVLVEFPYKHLRNFVKRIGYAYYLREFNLASIELPLGLILGVAGLIRGYTAWSLSNSTGIPTTAGTVVLTALLLLSSIQFILAFLNFDMNNYPKR